MDLSIAAHTCDMVVGGAPNASFALTGVQEAPFYTAPTQDAASCKAMCNDRRMVGVATATSDGATVTIMQPGPYCHAWAFKEGATENDKFPAAGDDSTTIVGYPNNCALFYKTKADDGSPLFSLGACEGQPINNATEGGFCNPFTRDRTITTPVVNNACE